MLLTELPAELLAQIVSHLRTARDLLHLLLTCEKLRTFIEDDGFRVFVQNIFPSFRVSSHWKEAARSLTTASKNWYSKAFLARNLQPGGNQIQMWKSRGGNPSVNHPRFSKAQSMGYRPVIDSYEQWTGEDWNTRKQILAVGAGLRLHLRVKWLGKEICKTIPAAAPEERALDTDQHYHDSRWVNYEPNQLIEGTDDITSVNLLRPAQKYSDDQEYVVIGRASGKLNLVRISDFSSACQIVTEYKTGKGSVRSATVNEASSPLLAACLSNHKVAVYSIYMEGDRPGDEHAKDTVSIENRGRTWCSRFLNQHRLAVGLGLSTEPLCVYDIGQAGISKEPVRVFRHNPTALPKADGSPNVTSVYSIVPVPPWSSGGGALGDVFVSGSYDGIVRLHDFRSPACHVATYTDSVDNSAIYSLACFGSERFIAGASRHSILKVFDLRLSGGKTYNTTDLDPCSKNSTQKPLVPRKEVKQAFCCQYHYDAKYSRRDYSLFLNRGNSVANTRATMETSVYSLSSPDPLSPTFFVGIENNVMQVDLVSTADRHPDPVYRCEEMMTAKTRSRSKKGWSARPNLIPLAMYEHSEGQIELKSQHTFSNYDKRGGFLDQRWYSSSKV